jgi:PKD repeat protein
LLQDDDQYEVRLRTSGTDPRGFPSLAGEAPATTELQQVTYTRDSSGNAKLYIDAVEIASMTLGGDFSTWDSYRFAMANDVQRARPWLGEIGLVAIYDTALSQADIEKNLLASKGEVGPPPAAPTADFEMSPTSGDAPLWAYITNLSSGNPKEFFWDYDDGIWTNVEEPVVHPYTTPGVYSPSLKVTNAGGSHTKKRTDYITVTDNGEEETGDRYYVSTTGDDRTGDGSKLDPWATIQKGVDEMRRGDTLIVREGTYEERVIFNNVQGASGAWYKIKNASGETPVISGRYSLPSGGSFASTCDGKGFVYGGLVQFNGTNRYIELNGIHIRESRGTGIRGHKDGNGRNLSFINCHIQDTRGATVGIRDYDNVLFEDCVLSGSMNYCQHPRAAREGKKWAGALVINRGAGHIIRGVLLYDSYGEGIHPFSWSGGVVEDCVIFNCMNGMMPITCCQNVTVQRNFVYSTRVFPFLTSSLLNLTMEAGAGADEGGSTQEGRKLKSRDCQVINNIAVDGSFCNRFMDRLSSKEKDYGWGFYKNSLFAHNTLVHHRDSTAEYIIRWLAMYHMGDIATMEFCNNIFWSSGASNKMAKIRAGSPRYRYNCWSQLPTKNKGGDYTNFMGEGDLYESPRLRNANFSLSADGTKGYEWLRRQAEQFQVTDKSPAVGAGRDAGVSKDFWGNNRGSSPSMGAHEP